MEVNREQADKCRDLGAEAMRRGDYARAVKMLSKSLQLYPLPGVEALLSQAQAKQSEAATAQSNSAQTKPSAPQRASSTASSSGPVGADGRGYNEEQVKIVSQILKAKEGGRGAHYRVLGLQQSCTESEIKKAYRKLSLKVHPDKNSAPHSDEAFKVVGLAYATLSDQEKRTIYDRYGDEDPDNRGGGQGGMHMRRAGPGQEMSPEDIFNMFFGGGMPPGGMGGGPGGFHFQTHGFGPGTHFRTGGPRQRQGGAQAQPQRQEQAPGMGSLIQFLPLILMVLLSFLRSNEDYFSLTRKSPYVNAKVTRLSKVKDIPYFVSDSFERNYARDPYQLAKVERMVEQAYENYLVNECQYQVRYKRRLEVEARKQWTAESRARGKKMAEAFELTRCEELKELFPNRQRKR